MIDTNNVTDAIGVSSQQHPIMYLVLLTFWVLMTFWMWKAIVAAIFGNSGDKLTDIQRTRLKAYEDFERLGITGKPK